MRAGRVGRRGGRDDRRRRAARDRRRGARSLRRRRRCRRAPPGGRRPSPRGGRSRVPSRRASFARAARRGRSSSATETVTSGTGARSPRHDSRSRAMRFVLGLIRSLASRHCSESRASARRGSRVLLIPAFSRAMSTRMASKSSPPRLVATGGGDGLVVLAGHVHERGVEGAAAQVVDDDVLASRGDGVAVAVRVLEAGGRRLVEHPDDLEACAAEGVERDEALACRARWRGSRRSR